MDVAKIYFSQKSPYSELFWSAFFTHFPAFGLNTERYGVAAYSVQMRKNAGKMRTRITPNKDTLYVVYLQQTKYIKEHVFAS